MKIPRYFTKGLSDFFRDKDVFLYSFEDIKDEHGRVTRSISDGVLDRFKGNVCFDKLEIIKEQY